METHPIATSPNGEMTLAEFVEHKLPKVTGPYVRVKEAILGDCFGGNAGLFMTKEELRKLPIREVLTYEKALMG